MHLKTKNLKSINYKLLFTVIGLGISSFVAAQTDTTLVITEANAINKHQLKTDTTSKTFQRYKADGVAAVIGDYLILESDIQKMRQDVTNQGIKGITDCQLAGRMMENKLYAHHGKLDTTIVVSDLQIGSQVDQQIAHMKEQLGSVDKMLEFYRKDTEQELRETLIEINKERVLTSNMQEKVVSEVEVTPEEVRLFFDNIPADERPTFGDEVEIAQLVIKPEVPQEEVQKVIDQLNEMRNDIVNNGASFATKAVLYSQDGTSGKGGKMSIKRDDPLDKDFKQIAFSLREGEVSKPFKSQFGYHIVQVDKVRGQNLDIRHIILIPKVTNKTVEAAKQKIDSIRQNIIDGKITFDAAARRYSDEEETRGDGGKLINPKSGDTRFELTDIDPLIYDKVNNLKKGEVSIVLTDQTRTGRRFFKIITVIEKYPEHVADYAKDYTKIKQLALQKKQLKEVQRWQTEKIEETYIKINGKYRDCEFESNWLKN
nr:peptidylprolyl isomerase [Mesonia hippocampi]